MKTSIFILLYIGSTVFSAQSGATLNMDWPQVSNFQITQKGASVTISWVANAESNDLYYVVESSKDGVHFTTAAVVLGGFENEHVFSYQFREKNYSNKTIYRIKQIKKDGSFHIAAEKTL